jgi:hypothetical protein
MSRELHDLVDLEGLSPEQCSRLERVHALLREVGPPVDLPATLREPPAEREQGAVVIPLRRRRPLGVLLVAASIAAVCFGCGYVIANEAHPSTVPAVAVIALQGSGLHDSFAALRVGAADVDGNLPVQLTVRGLPRLTNPRMRYALVFWDRQRPKSVIGMFTVGPRGATTVTFSVPFAIESGMHFAVTETSSTGQQAPGQVVMTNSYNS